MTPVFSRADEEGELLLCYVYSNKIDEVNEKARPASKGFVCRRVKQMQSLSWMVYIYNKPIDMILSKQPLRLMTGVAVDDKSMEERKMENMLMLGKTKNPKRMEEGKFNVIYF